MSKLIIFVETEQIRAAEKLLACIVNVFLPKLDGTRQCDSIILLVSEFRQDHFYFYDFYHNMRNSYLFSKK